MVITWNTPWAFLVCFKKDESNRKKIEKRTYDNKGSRKLLKVCCVLNLAETHFPADSILPAYT